MHEVKEPNISEFVSTGPHIHIRAYPFAYVMCGCRCVQRACSLPTSHFGVGSDAPLGRAKLLSMSLKIQLHLLLQFE